MKCWRRELANQDNHQRPIFEFSKGRATYRSDNLSTVVILRDVISRIVTMNQLKVHISCKMAPESIGRTLALIWPRLEEQNRLARRLELARGLKVRNGQRPRK